MDYLFPSSRLRERVLYGIPLFLMGLGIPGSVSAQQAPSTPPPPPDSEVSTDAEILSPDPGYYLVGGEEESPLPAAGRYQLTGIASWYGGKFQGRLTANGEVFDTNKLTAAHRELPFGTTVRVTNTTNDRSVVVRINDRGPFVDNRVIDLSRAAASEIGLTATGVAPVKIEILQYRPAPTTRTIQVASFGMRENAESLIERLTPHGLAATIERTENELYRVVILNVDVKDLPEVRTELGELGYGNVLVREP